MSCSSDAPFGTQRAAIDGMVGVALDVDHLRRHVLGFIANRVNEDATAHRTIGTRGSRLGGARNLEFFQLRYRGSQIKSKERESRATSQRTLEEGSAGEFHRVLQPLRSQLATTAKNHAAGPRPKLAKNYSPAPPIQPRIKCGMRSDPAVACGESKPHNRPVAKNPWQQRIRRAEQLADQHPFAAKSSASISTWPASSKGLYQRLQPVSANSSARLPDLPEFAELLASFPEFLSLVEGKAPAQFAQVARELRNSASRFMV